MLLVFFQSNILAQNAYIKGVVYGLNHIGKKEPLVGANLIWLGTTTGAVSNAEGKFELLRLTDSKFLIVSFIGYQSDTLLIGHNMEIEIILQTGVNLQTTEIVHHQKSTIVSHSATLHTENLGHGELSKAACCNLSESFETSPSVDVSFSDAITGTRQIRMLGLAGPYSQLTRENMPDIRGLSAVNGMEFIPGTWIDAIQLIKGAGSVVNGYESIAGQINTELQRYSTMPDFFLNMYLNNDRQLEANIQFKFPIGKNWQNAIFIHGKYSNYLRDMNKDGFADKPANSRVVLMDRMEWVNDKNIHLEFGMRAIYHDQLGGQTNFNPDEPKDTLHPWGLQSLIEKADLWFKIGKVNDLKPWNSRAIQVSGNVYEQHAFYGLNSYSGFEKSLYINAIQMGRIANEKNEYKVGMSILYDDFNEVFNIDTFQRLEFVPGIFGEYIFKPTHNFALVGGLRLDKHNQFGFFLTPRLHGRIELSPKMVLRFSAGRGFRYANIFSEHFSMLATNRSINIQSDDSGYGYGLKPEIAYNYGLNFSYTFDIDYREAVVGVSFYRTDFQNQIVFDMDRNFNEIHFYNLNGVSFANSFQTQIDYELVKRLDLRLAYRFYDVKTSFTNELMEAPLLAKHRGFLNLAYKTRKAWKFDFTINWVGQKRIPVNALTTEIVDFSPSFFMINAQITKTFNEVLDFYIGGENLNNYIQINPIIMAENPHQPGFDASLIWGPIWGQHIYAGFRYKFNK